MARLSREELLRRLVAFDSVSQHSNRPIADFICDYVDAPGVRIVRDDAPGGAKLNLVVGRGPEREDRSGLVLCGHMDTVPFGEPGWETDPLSLTRRADRYVGRGVCDMKGFLALALDLFTTGGLSGAHPLVLLLTYDEELGGLGARHFVETRASAMPLPRAAVIGEPTSLDVVRMHKGHLKLRVAVLGQPGHSAHPASGRNAIELAVPVILTLTELGRDLARNGASEAAFGAVPFATLNLATITGGVALNVIPDRCVLDLGIRFLPGTTGPALGTRVRGAVEGALGGGGYSIELINESPPMLTGEAAPIHRFLCTLVGQTASRGVSFTTDGGWLGAHDLDCVVFGPGSIDTAHKPNEWVPIAELDRAGDLLASTIRHWCGAPPG